VIPALAGVAGAMVLLIGAGTILLTYRETGSPEACFFEVVSAACNVGFHTGATPLISPEGRVALVLVMVLGRALPVALLLRGVTDVRRPEADVQAG
jgi:Trk-type K+ transport system membrane component